MISVSSNIKNLLTEIKSLSKKYNNLSPITLLAVSKGASIEKIEEAIKAGITNFGENYFQEAESKWGILKAKYPKVKLHFIGGIQTNKLKKIIRLCDVIQSIDSIVLINKALLIEESIHKEFFIEVKATTINYGFTGDKRKGINLENAKDLINYAKNKGLPIKGIMGIAPLPINNMIEANSEEFFKKLCILKNECNVPQLSIGMSNDYKIAIKHSSTLLRIGTKIFNNC